MDVVERMQIANPPASGGLMIFSEATKEWYPLKLESGRLSAVESSNGYAVEHSRERNIQILRDGLTREMAEQVVKAMLLLPEGQMAEVQRRKIPAGSVEAEHDEPEVITRRKRSL
jgi:hypothetical protein